MRTSGKPSIVVRRFAEADRAALRNLFLASRNAAFVWQPPAQRLEDFDAVTAGEVIYVAVNDALPVGFASVWEVDSFLHNLFVHPQWQRLGAGQALLRACYESFQQQPTLKCAQQNASALAFYRSQGWQTVGAGEGPDGAYWLLAGPWPVPVI